MSQASLDSQLLWKEMLCWEVHLSEHMAVSSLELWFGSGSPVDVAKQHVIEKHQTCRHTVVDRVVGRLYPSVSSHQQSFCHAQ